MVVGEPLVPYKMTSFAMNDKSWFVTELARKAKKPKQKNTSLYLKQFSERFEQKLVAKY